MVVDQEKHKFVTQRQVPCMALVTPSFPEGEGVLQLDAPEMPTLKVSSQETDS